jgi:hypothetical protein
MTAYDGAYCAKYGSAQHSGNLRYGKSQRHRARFQDIDRDKLVHRPASVESSRVT